MSRRSPSTDIIDSDDEGAEETISQTPDSVDLYDEEEKILRGRLPTFILGNRTTRPAIVTSCVTLVKEARKKGSWKVFTKAEAKALPFVVRSWFEEHCPDSLTGSVLSKGGRKWSLHPVIQRVLAEEVREYKKYLYEEYKKSKQYNDDIKRKGQALPLISFQATAVQEIIASLDSKDIERYNELASNWTLTKPGAEAQNQNTENNFTMKAQSFCRMAYMQMNARVFMMAAYTNTSGNIVTLPLDFSEVVGETSFFREYQDVLEESGVLACFEKFVKKELKGGKSAAHASATSEHIRPGVRALMVLQKNNYGEPVLLSPNRIPDDKEAKRFLGDMVRAVFTGLYALAQGKPGERVSVPWKQIKMEPQRFVSSKYMTPNIHLHFGDPSQITLDGLRAIVTELYQRQKGLRKAQSDAPYFWFRAYYDKKSNSWLNAHPRKTLTEVAEPDQPSRSDEPAKKSVTWIQEPGTGAANRPVTPLPKRARSDSPSKPQGNAPGRSTSKNPPPQRSAFANPPQKATRRSTLQSRSIQSDGEHVSRSRSRGSSRGKVTSRSQSPTKQKVSRSKSPTKQTTARSEPSAKHTAPIPGPPQPKQRPQIFPSAHASVSPSKKAAATKTPYPVAPLSRAYRSLQRSRSASPKKRGKTPAKQQVPTRGRSQRPASPDPVARRTHSRSRGSPVDSPVFHEGAPERGRRRHTKGVGKHQDGQVGMRNRTKTPTRTPLQRGVDDDDSVSMDMDEQGECGSDGEDASREWAYSEDGDDDDQHEDPVEGVDYSMEEEQVENLDESDDKDGCGGQGDMTDEISEFDEEDDFDNPDERQVSARPASAKSWSVKQSAGRRVQVPVSAKGLEKSKTPRPVHPGLNRPNKSKKHR